MTSERSGPVRWNWALTGVVTDEEKKVMQLFPRLPMDFFTASNEHKVSLPGHLSSPSVAGLPTATKPGDEQVDAFAEAINARYSRSGTVLIPLSPNQAPSTARPPPPPAPVSLPCPPPKPFLLAIPPRQPPPTSTPASSSSAAPAPPSAFTPLSPDALQPILADPTTLVLDVRPHNAYTLARLPTAVSLSVPSTLLKRPLFSLSKLAQMLSSASARARFTAWNSAHRILVYDADSQSLNEGGNLLGLMRKFRKEGFQGQVCWVKGGFHAIWRESQELVDRSQWVEDDEEDHVEMSISMSAPAAVGAFASSATLLRTKHLPMSAFTLSSTTTQRPPQTPMSNRADPFSTLATSLPMAASSTASLPGSSSSTAFSLRLPSRMTTTIPEGRTLLSFPQDPSSMPTPGGVYGVHARPHHNSMPGQQPPTTNVAYNPFFDTIRQNLELGGGRGSGDGIPLNLPRRVRRRIGELPFEWLREIARRSGKISSDSSSSSSPSSTTTTSASETEYTDESEDDSDQDMLRDVRGNKDSTRHSSSLSSPSPSPSDDLTKALAMQFYKIELGEQRRLMGVMEHHSKESSVGGPAMTKDGGKGVGLTERSATYAGSGASTENEGLGGVNMSGSKSEASAAISAVVKAGMFPFSITAGVEKGAKNRYRNIWPFEHARVRLSKARPEDDDYMNASYVQPLGTTKRYIATQGPLPATFTDFWTLCWEQNVHVIVMLTREVESSLVKCGNYWNEGTYGPLKLKLVSTTDTPEQEKKRRDSEMTSGFFNIIPPQATATKIPSSQKPKGKHRSSPPKGEQPSDAGVIRRVFELTHSGYPDAPPRVMTQLQYLEWPDLDVPKDPRGLLKLMREVDDVVEETRGSGERVWGEGPLSNSPRRRHLGSAYRTSPAEPSNRKGETGGFIAEDVEVDPVTGIAPHARSNPPVLLHCSAGVGRTGGFIAVDAILDAVRREMRMRKESNTGRSDSPGDASASASARGSGSGSRSPSDDPMEVDSRASASPSLRPREIAVAPAPAVAVTAAREGGGGEDVGLTMPVSVGGNEVHVPVAGFSSPIPVPMDVDGGGGSGLRVERPKMVMRPSNELINEVRRAQMTRMASSNGVSLAVGGGPARVQVGATAVRPVVGEAPRDPSLVRPGLSTGSGGGSSSRGSTSVSGFSTSGSSRMSSSHTASTTSLGTVATKNSSSESEPLDAAQKGSLTTTAMGKSPSSSNDSKSTVRVGTASSGGEGAQPDVEGSEPTRLDTWRSGVRDTHLTDVLMLKQKESSSSPPPEACVSPTTTVDYAIPRRLHDDASPPPLLSTYPEPIRRVIEDMREQRMSLCQSLRQYVFVHRAIIEGALIVVDAEKAREREVREEEERDNETVRGEGSPRTMLLEADTVVQQQQQAAVLMDVVEKTEKSGMPFVYGSGLDVGHGQSLGPAIVLLNKGHASSRKDLGSLSDVRMATEDTGNLSGHHGSTPSRAKRLTKELQGPPLPSLASGDVRVVKRPSVKRKQRSSDEEDGSTRLNEMVLGSPPPPGSR